MINFLEPPLLDRVLTALSLPASAEPALRALAAAVALLVALGGLESVRLQQAEERTNLRESDRDRLVRRVESLRSQERAIRAEQSDLDAALDLRRANERRAMQIARIGNALPLAVGLTTLRDAGDAWHFEGRAAQIGDIGNALENLRPLLRARGRGIVDVHQDERGERTLFFEVDLRTREP